MASNVSTQSSGGIGFTGLLAVLFIGLKLGGVIDWTWLWVLSPLWIPIVVILIFAALYLAFGVFSALRK